LKRNSEGDTSLPPARHRSASEVPQIACDRSNSPDNANSKPAEKPKSPGTEEENVLVLEAVSEESPRSKRRNKGSFLNFRTESFLRLRGKEIEKSDELHPSDSLNIPIHLQQLTTMEDNGKRFFGISLEAIMQRDNETGPVPSPVIKLVEYLEKSDAFKQEGIFRLCGNQENILNLIAAIDSGEEYSLSEYDIHEVAGVLKLYFQLLPQPILTFKLYPRFMAAVCLEDQDLRNSYYNALLATVPKMRREVSRYLLQILHKVAALKQFNKMGPKNLGIVFGPLLLRCQKQENDVYKSYLHYSKYIINCTKHMIKSIHALFLDVPPIQVVRTLTSYTAKKLGELDLTENSVIVIVTKGEEECFSESSGRFGTLPTHFLFNSKGRLKCDTAPTTTLPQKPPQVRQKVKSVERKKRSGSTRGPSVSKIKRRSNKGTLSDADFLNTFKVPKDIFLLLPKWKQDEMLREIGLLDPKQEGEGEAPAKSVTGSRTTIPVRPTQGS